MSEESTTRRRAKHAAPAPGEQLLPDGAEIARLRALPRGERPTFDAIGRRYGVSRQAVYKALQKYRERQAAQAREQEGA